MMLCGGFSCRGSGDDGAIGNNLPVAADDAVNAYEDTVQLLNVLANDTDPDGDMVSIDSFSQPSNGTVVDNGDGTLEYTPDLGFLGTDVVTYTISDGNGGTASATVIITVVQPTAGALIWAIQAVHTIYVAFGNRFDSGNGIAVLDDGSAFVTGSYESAPIFGLGEGNETTLVPSPGWTASDIFIARYTASGRLAWVKQAVGTGKNSGTSIDVLADGSTLVAGSISDTAAFGLGEPNETTLTSAGATDIFLARYNSDGTLLWAIRAGGVEADAATAVVAISDESVFVTGYFTGTAVFGQGETNETTLTTAGVQDIFIARYNPDGTLAWVKHAGGTDVDTGSSNTALPNGDSFVTGQFKGIAVFGVGEGNETTLTSAGQQDIFLARYNADGTLAWAKGVGGVSWDEGSGIDGLSDGTVYVVGYISDTVIFGAGESNQTTLFVGAGRDIFIAKYNSDGTLAWAKSAMGAGFNVTPSIAVRSDGSPYIAGTLSSITVFGSGEANEVTLMAGGPFITAYNVDGTVNWAMHTGNALLWGDFLTSIDVRQDGSTYITGGISGTVTYGVGEPMETTLNSLSPSDIYVARFAP